MRTTSFEIIHTLAYYFQGSPGKVAYNLSL